MKQYTDEDAMFARTMQGPFKHVEIAFSVPKMGIERVIVARPDNIHPDPRVFRELLNYSNNHIWEFLLIPCTWSDIGKISNALTEIIKKEDFFSEHAVHKAGLPWMPRFILDWYFGPEPKPAKGEPTYCTKVCLQGLQAAGMLMNQPIYMTSASDLWVAAKTHLGAFEVSSIQHSVEPVDAANYRVNAEYALGVEDNV